MFSTKPYIQVDRRHVQIDRQLRVGVGVERLPRVGLLAHTYISIFLICFCVGSSLFPIAGVFLKQNMQYESQITNHNKRVHGQACAGSPASGDENSSSASLLPRDQCII